MFIYLKRVLIFMIILSLPSIATIRYIPIIMNDIIIFVPYFSSNNLTVTEVTDHSAVIKWEGTSDAKVWVVVHYDDKDDVVGPKHDATNNQYIFSKLGADISFTVYLQVEGSDLILEKEFRTIEKALSCTQNQHEEENQCVDNSKMVACKDMTPEHGTKVDTQTEVTWENNMWSTAATCQWECDAGYYAEGGACVETEGTVYYIDAQNGNDSNNGEAKESAWKTIGHLLSESSNKNIKPGDTIAFKRGQTYFGRAYLNELHGTSKAPITFTSYGEGAKPILTNLGNLNPHWVKEETVNGITRWSTPIKAHVLRLWRDGKEEVSTVAPAYQHKEIKSSPLPTELNNIKREFFEDADKVWIWSRNENYKIDGWDSGDGMLNYATAKKPTGEFIVQLNHYSLFFDNSSYIDIKNLDFQGSIDSPISIRNSKHVNITNNSIGKKSGYGVKVKDSSDVLIAYNLFDADLKSKYTSNYSFAGVDARGVSDAVNFAGTVTDSEIKNNDFINWPHGGFAATTTSSDGIHDNKIHHNYFATNGLAYSRAIGYSGNTHHNEIHHNYIKNMYVPNQLCGHHNHFHHNTLDEVHDSKLKIGQQGSAISIDNYALETYNNIIEYNTISNTEGAGIAFGVQTKNVSMSRNTIQNNLFINCGSNIMDKNAFYSKSLWIPKYKEVEEQYIYNNAFFYDKNPSFDKVISYRDSETYLAPDELNTKDGNKGDKIHGNKMLLSIPKNSTEVGSGKLDMSSIGYHGDNSAHIEISNLTVTEVTDHSAVIKWEGVPDAKVWVVVHYDDKDDVVGPKHDATNNQYIFSKLGADISFTVYLQVEGSDLILEKEFRTPSLPLILANIQAQDITQTSVNIHWELNKKATGQVEYGETSSYGSFSKKETSFNYQAHTQHIEGLKVGTTYHYRVISKDKDGYEVISEDQIFTTLGDSIKPIITLKGESTVTLSVGDSYQDAGATATDDVDGDITNKIKVTSAVDTTKAGTYTVIYTVSDAAGNKAETKRTVVVKAVELTLANIQAQDITQTSVNIHWELNKKATGQVEYGETSSYGSFSKKETSFNYQAHTQHIEGLKVGTTYHYRVISKNKDGYEVISEDQTFTTLKEDKQQVEIDVPVKVEDHFKDIEIQKGEAEITSKNFLITTALPLNQQFYISYEIKGDYGANEVLSFVTNSRDDDINGTGPYFSVVASIGGHDITNHKWTKQVLPFHLDENLYLKGKRAKKFNTSTVYLHKDIIVIEPSKDITAEGYSSLAGGKYMVNFYKDNKYVIKIYKDKSLGNFSSLEDMLNSALWTLPLEFRYSKFPNIREFKAYDTYKHNQLVLIKPTEDIEAIDIDPKKDDITYRFEKDKEYVIRIEMDPKSPEYDNKKDNGITPSSLKEMLDSSDWTYSEIFTKTIGKKSYIRDIKITKNPYDARKKRTAITLPAPDSTKDESGQYSITEHGVLQKDTKPFFPITIYDSYGDRESTVKRWKDYVAHGIDGILANYVSLPWAYEAGMKYNAMKWGTSGGPYLNDHLTSPRRNDIAAWNTIYALSYDQEALKFMYHSKKYIDSAKYVKKEAASKIRQQLLGNFNQAPFFEKDSHLFGTYIRYDAVSNNLYRTTKLRNLEAIDRTSNTFGSIMNINTGAPEERFKAEVMGGIIYGATQLTMWTGRGSGDLHGREGRLEKQPWYDHDILDLKKYINKMLDIGLIGSGLEGEFEVSKPLDYRKLIRAVEVDGVGYLVLSNLQDKDIVFNEAYKGLGYEPEGDLVDILTGEVYGHIDNNRFEVTVPAYGYRVLEIK